MTRGNSLSRLSSLLNINVNLFLASTGSSKCVFLNKSGALGPVALTALPVLITKPLARVNVLIFLDLTSRPFTSPFINSTPFSVAFFFQT